MSEKPATKRGRLVNALRETHREVAAVNPWKGGIDVGWIEGKLHWLCMLAEQLPSPAACAVEHEVTEAMLEAFHAEIEPGVLDDEGIARAYRAMHAARCVEWEVTDTERLRWVLRECLIDHGETVHLLTVEAIDAAMRRSRAKGE